MYTNLNLGHARFGKRDGFEMTAKEGVLRDFRTAEAQDYLNHAILLRQEEIRPFQQAEILGLTNLYWQGRGYRCLTLYRYALDQYKRDGYRAVSLCLRDSWADPSLLLDELRHLSELDLHHPDPEKAFNPSWRGYELARPSIPGRSQEVFIPLGEGSLAEQAALLKAWVNGLDGEYQTVFASGSPKVLASIDSGRISVWERNPYWHVVPEPVVSAGQNVEIPRPNAPAPSDSLIHAFETGDEQHWNKRTTTRPNPTRPIAQNKGRDGQNFIWLGLIILSLGLAGLLALVF